MLKEAVRRLLWLRPTLLVVPSIFWVIARSADLAARRRPTLPLFFNPSPAGSRNALSAVSLVVSGGESASDEPRRARLGGRRCRTSLPSSTRSGRAAVSRSRSPIAAAWDQRRREPRHARSRGRSLEPFLGRARDRFRPAVVRRGAKVRRPSVGSPRQRVTSSTPWPSKASSTRWAP